MEGDVRVFEALDEQVAARELPQRAIGHEVVALVDKSADQRAGVEREDLVALQVAPHARERDRGGDGLGPACNRLRGRTVDARGSETRFSDESRLAPAW
jgi:hypothetical protein